MPVLQADGLVGRVEKTSDHHAQVILFGSPTGFAVDCLSQRSRVRGVWAGHPDGFCQIKYVSRNDDIQTGDPIITSGLDELFPKGIPLGRVKRVVSKSRATFCSLKSVLWSTWDRSKRSWSSRKNPGMLLRRTTPQVIKEFFIWLGIGMAFLVLQATWFYGEEINPFRLDLVFILVTLLGT